MPRFLSALIVAAAVAGGSAGIGRRPSVPLRVLRGGAGAEEEGGLPAPKLRPAPAATHIPTAAKTKPAVVDVALSNITLAAVTSNATARGTPGPRGRAGARGRGRSARGRGASATGRGAARPRGPRPAVAPEAVSARVERDEAMTAPAATTEPAALAIAPSAAASMKQRAADEGAVTEAIRSLLLWKDPASSALALASGNAAFALAIFGPWSAATSFGGLAFWLVLLAVPFALTYQALSGGAASPDGSIPRSFSNVVHSLAAALPGPLQPGGELLPPAAAAVAARTVATALNRAFAALRSAGAVDNRAHTLKVRIVYV